MDQSEGSHHETGTPMKEYLIEKNVPPPLKPGTRRGKSKYPFWKMEVGDSFVVRPVDQKLRVSIAQTMRRARVTTGWTFCSEWEGDGMRYWRIK